MDAFWAAPPVTRTLAGAIFFESILCVARAISVDRLYFAWPLILKSTPEIWRFVTSFLYTGGIGIILVPYGIWNYGGPLERDSARFDSGTFLIYLLFVGSIIIGLGTQIFGSVIFTGPLFLAIAYTYAQDNRGQQVQFFFINLEVKYLPYAMLFLTFVQGGPEAMFAEAIGIPAAHLWDFFTLYWPQYGGGVNFLKTPEFVHQWFVGMSGAKQVQVKGHGTSFRTAPSMGSSSTSAFSSGSNWGTRGQGQRLGGD